MSGGSRSRPCELGGAVTDFGNRVSQASMVGGSGAGATPDGSVKLLRPCPLRLLRAERVQGSPLLYQSPCDASHSQSGTDSAIRSCRRECRTWMAHGNVIGCRD